jgi:hypothetical protein
MTETIEIDIETARLIDQLAKLDHTNAGVIIKDAVVARANAAGFRLAAATRPVESADQWVRRTIDILDMLPERLEDNRSINDIIGYDENGMP